MHGPCSTSTVICSVWYGVCVLCVFSAQDAEETLSSSSHEGFVAREHYVTSLPPRPWASLGRHGGGMASLSLSPTPPSLYPSPLPSSLPPSLIPSLPHSLSHHVGVHMVYLHVQLVLSLSFFTTTLCFPDLIMYLYLVLS